MKAKGLTLVVLCCFFQVTLKAQNRQKAESNFLAEINNILQHSPNAGLYVFMDSMMVDTPFTIKAGVLSVAVRYLSDSKIVKIRAEAPVSHLTYVSYDHYLVLRFNDESVTQYEEGEGDDENSKTIKKDYMHIGTPVKDGYKEKERLQKLLEKLLKYYKK